MHRALRTLPTLTACLCTAGLSTAWLVSRIGRLDLERTSAAAPHHHPLLVAAR